MINMVYIHEIKGFVTVPLNVQLKRGDKVIIKNLFDEQESICLTDNFTVDEDDYKKLFKSKSVQPPHVIGKLEHVDFSSFKEVDKMPKVDEYVQWLSIGEICEVLALDCDGHDNIYVRTKEKYDDYKGLFADRPFNLPFVYLTKYKFVVLEDYTPNN